MKKILAITLAALMLLSLAACGEASTPPTPNNIDAVDPGASVDVQLPDPVKESTYDEIMSTFGFDLTMPENAADPIYSIIETDPAIAQVNFALDGNKCGYRMQFADEPADISGMSFTWANEKDVTIDYCGGKLAWNDGAEGVCYYYEMVNGLLYCVFMESGASEQALTDLANTLFVPSGNN